MTRYISRHTRWILLALSLLVILVFAFDMPAGSMISQKVRAAANRPEVLSAGQIAAVQGSQLVLQEAVSLRFLPIIVR